MPSITRKPNYMTDDCHYYDIDFVHGKNKPSTFKKIVKCLNIISTNSRYIYSNILPRMLEKMLTVLMKVSVEGQRYTFTNVLVMNPHPVFVINCVIDYLNVVTDGAGRDDYCMKDVDFTDVSMKELDDIYNVLAWESKKVLDNKTEEERLKANLVVLRETNKILKSNNAYPWQSAFWRFW